MNHVYRARLCIHGTNESTCRHPDCIGPVCAYCGSPATDRSLMGTRYCSLECLCLYNAARVRAERLTHVRLPYRED